MKPVMKNRQRTLAELREALALMSECHRTASLRGMVVRIEAEFAAGRDAADVIRRLRVAAERAFDADPIARFVRASRRLSKTGRV